MTDELKQLEENIREGIALIQQTDKKLSERLEAGLSGVVKREEIAKIEETMTKLANDADERERKFLAESSKRAVTTVLDDAKSRLNKELDLCGKYLSGAVSRDEYRKLADGSDNSTSHYVIAPPTVATEILTILREFSPMMQICGTQNIRGKEWEQVRQTAGGSAGRVSERGTRTATTRPTMGKLKITAHGYYAEPTVTQFELFASDIDLGAFFMQDGNEEMMELVETDFVSGDGVDKPFGFTGNATLQAAATVTGSASTIASFDPLRTATGAIHETFLPNARWMMKRSTEVTLAKLKDGAGVYLLQPVTAGMPSQLMGFPISYNGYMPAIADYATNPYCIAFGDFKAGYKIVTSNFMLMLRDELTSKGSVILYKEVMTGGDVILRVGGQAINLVKIST